MKTCTKCGEAKPRSEFYADPGKRDGLKCACKSCVRAQRQEYRASDRGRAAARNYREQNRDKHREWERSWARANPEKKARWKRENPDAVARHRSKDRARRYGAEHAPYSRAAVFERWGSRCCYCDGEATTLDHVAPLGFGGHDVEANVVPACARCNSSKGRKTLAEWAGLS
ncbi:bacteriophage protein [Streptomyces aureoverticillatus]|nr:bacteriophage protein [Streptomyces aureoverticillatus]